jgi:hypothetical protein
VATLMNPQGYDQSSDMSGEQQILFFGSYSLAPSPQQRFPRSPTSQRSFKKKIRLHLKSSTASRKVLVREKHMETSTQRLNIFAWKNN